MQSAPLSSAENAEHQTVEITNESIIDGYYPARPALPPIRTAATEVTLQHEHDPPIRNSGTFILADTRRNSRAHPITGDSVLMKRARQPRYCCGIFQTRKTCRLTCIPFILILLATLGFLGWFLYPRFPTLSIGKPYIPTTGPGLVIKPDRPILQALADASPATPFNISIAFEVPVTVISQNNFDISASALRISVYCLLPRESFCLQKIESPSRISPVKDRLLTLF